MEGDLPRQEQVGIAIAQSARMSGYDMPFSEGAAFDGDCSKGCNWARAFERPLNKHHLPLTPSFTGLFGRHDLCKIS